MEEFHGKLSFVGLNHCENPEKEMHLKCKYKKITHKGEVIILWQEFHVGPFECSNSLSFHHRAPIYSDLFVEGK